MADNNSITLKGRKIDYVIQRIEKFSRITFEVKPSGQLLITLPAYLPDKKILPLLKDNSQLILDEFHKFDQKNAPEPTKKTQDSEKTELPYTLIRKKTTKVSIKINSMGEISLIIPEKYPLKKALEFFHFKKDWINGILAKIKSASSQKHIRKMIFEDRSLLYEGKKHSLKVIENLSLPKSILKIKQRGNEPQLFEEKQSAVKTVFELHTPSFSNRAEITKTLVHGLKNHAKQEMKKLLDEESLRMGIRYKALRVKDVKTRWGSCSSKKNINLCWRLILLPKECQRYVVIHELCHIKELNHSSRYWNLVKQHMPDFLQWRNHLKKHGNIAYTL